MRRIYLLALSAVLVAPSASFYQNREDCWSVQIPKNGRTAALNTYFAPYFEGVAGSTEDDIKGAAYIVPVDATIKEMRVLTENSPGFPSLVTHTIMEVTDGALDVTCTRALTVLECTDTTSVDVDQYDLLYERLTKNAGVHDPGYGMTELLLCERL